MTRRDNQRRHARERGHPRPWMMAGEMECAFVRECNGPMPSIRDFGTMFVPTPYAALVDPRVREDDGDASS